MATKLLRLVKDKKKLDEGGSITFTIDSDETPFGISANFREGLIFSNLVVSRSKFFLKKMDGIKTMLQSKKDLFLKLCYLIYWREKGKK